MRFGAIEEKFEEKIDTPKRSIYVDSVNLMLGNSKEGSNIYILENGVFISKLLNDQDSFFKESIKIKEITPHIYTWKGLEIEKDLERLSNIKNLNLYFLPKKEVEHYTITDNPKAIWAELTHEEHSNEAHNCFFTKEAFPDVWKQIRNHMSKLEKVCTKFE